MAEIRIYTFEETDSRSPEARILAAASELTEKPAVAGEWKVDRTERGKPFFPGHPEVYLSITHSGAYWVCALADSPVGIDLQEHVTRPAGLSEDREAHCRKMASRFFHKKEAVYVQEKDTYRRFFRVWAAKESYVKYTGSGIDGQFGGFSVIPEESDRLPDICKNQQVSWKAAGAWFAEYPAESSDGIPGYTLCICTKTPAGIHRIVL